MMLARDPGESTPHGHDCEGCSLEQQKRQALCLLVAAVNVRAYSTMFMIPQPACGSEDACSRTARS